MFAIMSPEGRVGGRVARLLLRNGFRVRIIDEENARESLLIGQGAERACGAYSDPDFLQEAFSDAQAVLTVLPISNTAENPDALQRKIGKAIVGALKKTHVRNVVNISAVGVQSESAGGFIRRLREQEQLLDSLQGLDIVHIRPAFYMENLLWYLPGLERTGVLSTPLREDVVLPMVAASDVASLAAAFLHYLDFRGKTHRKILGERSLSMEEVTSILGYAMGLPHLSYRRMSYEQAEDFFLNKGCTQRAASAQVRFYRDVNEGGLYSHQMRTAQTSAETPFEEFAAQATQEMALRSGQEAPGHGSLLSNG